MKVPLSSEYPVLDVFDDLNVPFGVGAILIDASQGDYRQMWNDIAITGVQVAAIKGLPLPVWIAAPAEVIADTISIVGLTILAFQITYMLTGNVYVSAFVAFLVFVFLVWLVFL